MAAEARGYWATDRTVCLAHVDDSVLKAAIADHLSEPNCSYCEIVGDDSNPVAAPLDDLLDVFMVGVRHLYEEAEASGVPIQPGRQVTTVYDADDVVWEVLEEHATTGRTPDDGLASDITAALTTQSWVRRDWQRLTPDQVLQYSWDSFKELVKYSTRFFFTGALGDASADGERLSVLEFFRQLAAVLSQTPEIFPQPCPRLFRGRMTATDPDPSDYDAAKLGPPPPQRAAANRMSPAGISMFYGATDLDTAVAEIGAHSSYGYAVTGEFTTAREVRLIDLTKLPAIPSIFDEQSFRSYYTISFLHNFVRDLTLPVDLDGREHIDYVPTQVFTEYLKYSFPARVDGLMFPSAQGPGANVVVFYGPEFCADEGDVGDYTRLILIRASVTKHRVTTVIKR
ncbi:hypothetical protein MMAD_55910 (plasmid) [Mycolicibacterium madagascariense]|uniref:RES domain-containing protein n=1 Tax=Mycolicibacterium madagascariense TaxID=212765 RepID=A0A7I7XPZ4_9MYCO|nr:HEPN-associated N-terminal domain-containing protein [Mycolicibacterium madagascariense]BBZ31296.1 hypothetical protein MMAD_55910 [Mycolicibacterium madagascariense]